ncbi:MAG TPA: ABC transporter substrate-binding protein, partial [Polyangiaceae bacterium]
ELVGRSHECDYPPEVAALPALTRARLPSSASSAAIDADVRALVERALALYEVELDALARANPDVVVTQDLCEVCAVPFSAVCRAVDAVLGGSTRVLSLRPERLADVWDDVRRVARAIGRPEAGEALARELAARARAVSERVPANAARPAVLSVEWIAPVMIGGLWMPELIELGGGVPLVTRPGERAPTLGREALARLEPDVVLVKPCGFTLERTLAERGAIADALPWDGWRAVREGRVYVADGNAYFNRSGPRLVESLELLAACTHPAHFADFRERHTAALRRLTHAGDDVPA